jgi:glycosyltransferase involved in cell wall biosynthesis
MARSLPAPDVVVVGYMGHLDVHLARRLYPRATIVLDHMISARDTAIDRRIANSLLLGILDRLDRAALRRADVAMVDTIEHRALLPEARRRHSLVVPIGAPSRWFGPALREAGPALRVIFYGTFAPLQGGPIIGEAIGVLADSPAIEFTLIGAGQDLDAARRAAAENPRVTWHEWVDPQDLPAVVGSHDVCLGIFGTTPKAARVVPHKVFEGAAAGCAIVTSDTPPQRRALGDAAHFVPAGDGAALAAALRGLAGDRERLGELRDAAAKHADASFRPAAVAGPLADRLSGEIR